MDMHDQNRPARICMATTRLFNRQVFRCSVYEAEDVLVKTDAVDLIYLQPGPQFQWQNWLQKRLVYRDLSDKLILANPGLEQVKLTKDYDLFVAMFQNHEDIAYINAIEGWRDRCKISVCWLDEIWSASIHTYRHWLSALRQFDYVFIGSSSGSVDQLSGFLGRRCHWSPLAVDALRFCPFPNPVPRPVDVYSMGRKSPGLHAVFREMAADKEIFYLYDTYAAANAPFIDHQQHRDLLANLSQRSRYFVVAPAKMDSPDETDGQIEFGPRYYEAVAAGSVLIGQAPDSLAFSKLFDRPDVVVEIKPDGSNAAAMLKSLNSDPEFLQSMSSRNAIDGLLHHDWSYRWKSMFKVIGLEESPRMAGRQSSLRSLADQVSSMKVPHVSNRVAIS
jgi:Glycosyl transferases group 1